MPTGLKTILDHTASAIAGNPSLAAARFDADCELVGVHEVDVRVNNSSSRPISRPRSAATTPAPSPSSSRSPRSAPARR